MEPLIYVMAILGCGDAGDACLDVRTVPVTYASRDACVAASADILGGSTDLDYPMVTAECRASRGAAAGQVRLASNAPVRR